MQFRTADALVKCKTSTVCATSRIFAVTKRGGISSREGSGFLTAESEYRGWAAFQRGSAVVYYVVYHLIRLHLNAKRVRKVYSTFGPFLSPLALSQMFQSNGTVWVFRSIMSRGISPPSVPGAIIKAIRIYVKRS